MKDDVFFSLERSLSAPWWFPFSHGRPVNPLPFVEVGEEIFEVVILRMSCLCTAVVQTVTREPHEMNLQAPRGAAHSPDGSVDGIFARPSTKFGTVQHIPSSFARSQEKGAFSQLLLARHV